MDAVATNTQAGPALATDLLCAEAGRDVADILGKDFKSLLSAASLLLAGRGLYAIFLYLEKEKRGEAAVPFEKGQIRCQDDRCFSAHSAIT